MSARNSSREESASEDLIELEASISKEQAGNPLEEDDG